MSEDSVRYKISEGTCRFTEGRWLAFVRVEALTPGHIALVRVEEASAAHKVPGGALSEAAIEACAKLRLKQPRVT